MVELLLLLELVLGGGAVTGLVDFEVGFVVGADVTGLVDSEVIFIL